MIDSESLDEKPINYDAFLQENKLPQTELTHIIYEMYLKQNRRDKENGVNN